MGKTAKKMELREAVSSMKGVYAFLAEKWPSEAMRPIGIAIQCMMDMENDGWISVKDRLPREGENVLVTEEFDGARKVVGGMYYSGSPYWRNHVIAWMPKPEPYTGDQNETGV